MADELLSDAETRGLRLAVLTYPEVGATRGPLPAGYHHLTHSGPVGAGRDCFEAAARCVLDWQMHRGAGLEVRSSDPSVVEGCVAVVRLGVGPLAVRAPVRVVQVVEESRRRGFAYGTLPGHPECGEELFLVEHHGDDRVTLTITAFSRPASRLARCGGPVSRVVQRWVTRRYLRAVQA